MSEGMKALAAEMLQGREWVWTEVLPHAIAGQAEDRHRESTPATKEQLMHAKEARERARLHRSIMWGYLFGHRSVRP